MVFLEQLYARYRQRVGNKTLKSNKGVAQGSIISHEDLSDELKIKAEIDLEDLLYSANDLLTISTSLKQIKKVIQIISDWSDKNRMLLNKKKSGIIFANRKATKVPMTKLLKNESDYKNNKNWVPTQVELDGVPIS